ncbi:hypothetical protein F511_33777 [Dorcoceras hygrometricum]|uniref:Uncharacterized protein n=1 Tax=Dorcoceras hygrometricum TaxID=472368 RepID=A0A2Z7CZR8_9LAMI|nr:hypothetical protein F511_33777 [Dorcoceras hygrometricum]
MQRRFDSSVSVCVLVPHVSYTTPFELVGKTSDVLSAEIYFIGTLSLLTCARAFVDNTGIWWFKRCSRNMFGARIRYLVSPSSSLDSSMRFTTADIPLSGEPTAVLPPDLTNAFAQLRASVDQISLEHVQTIVHIERVKEEFFAKISILETLLLTRADNQDRAARVHTEIFRKEVKDQKASLSKEFEDQLTVIHNDLLEFHVETQEQYTTLRDNLAEVIAFFNRGRDDKKGEVGSRQGQGPQPPPDDWNRPG